MLPIPTRSFRHSLNGVIRDNRGVFCILRRNSRMTRRLASRLLYDTPVCSTSKNELNETLTEEISHVTVGSIIFGDRPRGGGAWLRRNREQLCHDREDYFLRVHSSVPRKPHRRRRPAASCLAQQKQFRNFNAGYLEILEPTDTNLYSGMSKVMARLICSGFARASSDSHAQGCLLES